MPHKRLSEIYNQKVFRVPDYQRGYSWGDDQLEYFWNDIVTSQGDHSHFCGTITLERIENISSYANTLQDAKWLCDNQRMEPLFIVDGQQRLTSAMIFIKCILNRLPENEWIGGNRVHSIIDKYLYFTNEQGEHLCLFGYQSDDPSYKCWRQSILGIDLYGANLVETVYTKNLINAKLFFEKKLGELKDGDVEPLLNRLQHHLVFNEDLIEGDFDVSVAFETMNNRGKDLSVLELLKNRLIYLSQIMKARNPEEANIYSDLREKINQTWRVVYEILGKSPELNLSDDDFLKVHWIMYFGHKKKESDQLEKSLLQEQFSVTHISSGKVTRHDLEQYIDSLANSVRHWHDIKLADPGKNSKLHTSASVLKHLKAIGHKSFEPLIVAAISKGDDSNQLDELLRSIERFIFIAYFLCDQNNNFKQPDCYRFAKELYHKELTIRTTTDLINNWIIRLQNNNGIKQDFLDHIKKLYRNDSGFYSWDGLRYFLYRYEQDLKGDNEYRLTWLKSRKKRSVEHILPQAPTNDYWKEIYSGISGEAIQIVKNSLGNLVLMDPDRNSQASNKSFPEKCNDYYTNGTLSEREIRDKYSNRDWDVRSIYNRGVELIQYMDRTWGLNLIPPGTIYTPLYDELLLLRNDELVILKNPQA